jgi:hypothetical protein
MNMKAITGRFGFHASLVILILIFPVVAEAAPRIFYTDIDSGPNTGGENDNGAYLSIFGKGFGADLGQVKVYVGDGEVARYMYLGPSLGRPDVQQLSVQLGKAASSGPIKVVVNGVDSNIDHRFTVRPGNFYFISPNGKDSHGKKNNIERPYRHPNYIKDLSGFRPGDFIIALPGTYQLANENYGANAWLRADKSGTAEAPLSFLGYPPSPGKEVDVQFSNNNAIISNYVSIAHWVVGNFKVSLTDCVGAGEIIALGATTTPSICKDKTGTMLGKVSFVKIVNIDADGHDSGGFCSGGDGLIEISYSEGVKILGVALHNTSPAKGDEESAHAIYLSTRQKGTEVGWNAVYNMPATRAVIQVHQDSFGGVCWSDKQITDITIHDNLLHDLAGQAILLDGGTGDIQVYNNIIYNHRDRRYGDVIALRGGGRKLNALLYNNVVYANARAERQGTLLDIGYNSGMPARVTLLNNIFYAPDPQDLYYDTEVNGGMLAFKAWVASGNLTSDYNLWYGSKSPKPAFAGPHALHAEPRFVDPAKGDFRLRHGSPAIGKGTSKVSPVVSHDYDMNFWAGEGRYDIGAYQYRSGTE